MKSAMRRIAAIAAITTTAAVSTLSTVAPSLAAQFGQKEVDQNQFVAIASPFRGGSAHQLLIIEQIADSRQCWSESGSAPTLIDPLLLDFDFTGICGRSTDSNGYSIRVNGEDWALRYSLRIVRRNGDMLLVGAPRDRNDPELLIGRTNGETSDFAKVYLESGWRFAKRTYEDRTLGHVYLTYEGTPPTTGDSSGGTVGTNPTPNPTPNPSNGGSDNAGNNGSTPSRFNDTTGDIYLAEINQAVEIGFISGFEDDTFRPQASLTREQLVSMVLGALDSLPNVNLNIPTQASGNPYSDVEAGRWSAARIQFARDNNIIQGYEDGTFRPTQPVTRAELMAVLRRTSEYAKVTQGQSAQLQGNLPEIVFSDTQGHWANSLISQMSTFCNVATPVNERGNSFAPDSSAQRNYAAAATLRVLNCVSPAEETASQ
ncbi:MAG: DUF3747 domain-containing protein [Cyanobacteria bacterium RU_5_0]|nr:DUF3747 domain-containing protein [Cyanobacteria bacterium RU_5_0]